MAKVSHAKAPAAAKLTGNAATLQEAQASNFPTLEHDVMMKIATLKQSGMDSKAGREIAMAHIIEDVEAGHIDTDLEGADLKREIIALINEHKIGGTL